MPVSQWLLVILLALFAYPYALYPALLWLIPVRRRSTPPELPDSPPSVALIVCALNEERVIRDKLENSLQLDYPADRLKIVFVNDGSTDRTAEIISEYASRGIDLISRSERRGKLANLRDVVPARTEEIIVLSDANVIYDPQAVRRLVAPFADAKIGCVSGKVVITDSTDAIRQSEEKYYSVEWFLQERASAVSSMVGADGAMYAFRRELFVCPPAGTLIEDLAIPMAIVRQGYRVVHEPTALGWEEGPASVQEEFRRKVRIAAGAAQALLWGTGVPGGKAPLSFWFIWASHKLLRWLSPVVGVIAVILAAATANHVVSKVVLAGTVLLLAMAAIRWLTGVSWLPLNAAFYFVFGQLAVLWGLIKGVLGKQSVLWAKANR
jgi:cellulose synthase/poly-beta-1,6-N-acetylglucosamine synthase-like glycosyltransferase